MHGALVLVLLLGLYFLPTLIGRNKRNAGAIFALNLLLGWTVIGWIVSLVWALTQDAPVVGTPVAQAPQAWVCTRCRAPVNRGQGFCQVCGTAIGWPPST